MVFTRPFYTYKSLSLNRSSAILVFLVPMLFLVLLHLRDDPLVPWPRWRQQCRRRRDQSGCHRHRRAISVQELGSPRGPVVVQPPLLSVATATATYHSVASHSAQCCNGGLPDILASATWDRRRVLVPLLQRSMAPLGNHRSGGTQAIMEVLALGYECLRCRHWGKGRACVCTTICRKP
jgi:hypothetical protein